MVPADPGTMEAIKSMKQGAIITADFKLKNNYEFHKKLFALLTYAYDNWEPGEIDTKWGRPEKNFEVFRESVAIMAGYFDTVFMADGSFRLKAKSLSFGSMEADERCRFYQTALTVICERILPQFDRAEVEEVAAKHWNQLMSFA